MKRSIVVALGLILIVVVGILIHNVEKRKEEVEEELNISLPESRSFYMGTTPLPYDFTKQAVEKTYGIVSEHTDLIAHHFDSGVPWPEAFEGKPYHPNVEANINTRLRHLQEGQKVYLAVTPISNLRDGLAKYWGEKENMERPGIWKNKDFDDPDVIKAYTNFCRYMIQKFHPDFMAYGIEVNILAKSNPGAFEKFLVLAEQVYQVLKEENPQLPLFLTIQIDTFHENEGEQRKAIEKLLPYTDYIAVSSYPFSYKADPKDLPEDWFSEVAELAPEKPFAVAETGFIAEDLILQKYGVRIPGSERWQAEYVQFLLSEANKLNAKFIVWFCPVDYDLLWEKIKGLMDEFFKMWRDTGLLNEKLEERQSLKVWDAWLKLPLRGEENSSENYGKH